MAEFNQMDEWIVDDLVESIKENHTIWREPFERDENADSLPRSGVTGEVFKTNLEGFARLLRQFDFTDPRWMTKDELENQGWILTPEAKGVVVGKDNYDKNIVVFNVSQAQPKTGRENNIKPWDPEIKEKQWFNIARADFILESSGANIKYGFRGSQYNAVSDNICLPYQSNFRSADDYYWTAFHELMHWTGSHSRLGRNTSGNKNSPLYAREELVAELGAYMMCLRTGISFDKSNASAYIKGWAENMQLDSASLKKELTLAWGEARRACDFVSRKVLENMKKNNMKLDNSGRVYLNVERTDVKDVIKLGARYDTRQYAFYITPEYNFTKFNKYLSEDHRVSDIGVSQLTKTQYERDEDKAEEIRRNIEAEANAPPVEAPTVNMNSNLARYIAYSAIKSEPQLKSWCDSDIISEIQDTENYVDSSHFAHDVADKLKKQIVASIAKYSKNSSESDIYEQWDRDVNAYVKDGNSIFVQMDSALSSLKFNLKDSFEDDVNHIRMLDEASHDDAFLALINPKTEEAEQVEEFSENIESVQKNENLESVQKNENSESVQKNENLESVQKNENSETEDQMLSINEALAEIVSMNPNSLAAPDELLERHFQEGYQKQGYYKTIDLETFKKIDAVLPQESDKDRSLENWYQWEHRNEDWNRADVINYISSDRNVLNYVLEKGQMPPLVFMHWSESRALSDEFKKTGGFLPFAEADRIITAEDEEYAKLEEGYEKTKLTLLYLSNRLDGNGVDDQSYPHMRYDCGDLDGGLIKHIESWCDWCIEHYEDEREIMREYKTIHLPMLEYSSNQFEAFRQNQSQEAKVKQSQELNWSVNAVESEQNAYTLELLCEGRVISSAVVSQDISEKRLNRIINNFTEELAEHFDVPEEQFEELQANVAARVNHFINDELNHEKEKDQHTTLENNTYNNYTDNENTSVFESKENQNEISSGMGGESEGTFSRAESERSGSSAEGGESGETGNSVDHRTAGEAGSIISDGGQGRGSSVLQGAVRGLSESGRGSGRGRFENVGKGDVTGHSEGFRAEEAGGISDRRGQGPVVFGTSRGVEGNSGAGQEGNGRETSGTDGRFNEPDRVASEGFSDMRGVSSARSERSADEISDFLSETGRGMEFSNSTEASAGRSGAYGSSSGGTVSDEMEAQVGGRASSESQELGSSAAGRRSENSDSNDGLYQGRTETGGDRDGQSGTDAVRLVQRGSRDEAGRADGWMAEGRDKLESDRRVVHGVLSSANQDTESVRRRSEIQEENGGEDPLRVVDRPLSGLQNGSNRGRREADESALQGRGQGVPSGTYEELDERNSRTERPDYAGNGERTQMETELSRGADALSPENQSGILRGADSGSGDRGGKTEQSEILDGRVSEGGRASGKDSDGEHNEGRRPESGISNNSRKKRSKRNDASGDDLGDFGELSRGVDSAPQSSAEDDFMDALFKIKDDKAKYDKAVNDYAERIEGMVNDLKKDGVLKDYPSDLSVLFDDYDVKQNAPYVEPVRYRITDLNLGNGSETTRLNNNMEALRTLKTLTTEDRNATPEEQEKLAKYVGWGGLSNVFDIGKHEFDDVRKELRELLTNREYNDARASTLTAFYTPPEVIKSIYRGLEKAGFKGGRILEPSCGIGNFFGMLPESMSNSELHGVELDSVSSRIAQKLYPDATISHEGFEEYSHEGYFDVVIGNVPFGSFRMDDGGSKYSGNLIHNYFIGKSIEQVCEGGIVALVTSTGTMDSPSAKDFREEVAHDAELLGAMRLPEGVFSKNAGTSVSSDILFFQKRHGRLEALDYADKDSWTIESINFSQFKDAEGNMHSVERAQAGLGVPASWNISFRQPDEQFRGVCGRPRIEQDRFGKTVCNVKMPNDTTWQALLENEVEKQLPENVYQDIDESQKVQYYKDMTAEEAENIVNGNGKKDFLRIGIGSLGVVDDEVFYRKDKNRFEKLKLTKEEKDLAIDWIAMKEQLNLIKKIQITGKAIEHLPKQQEILRTMYEHYYNKHGRMNGEWKVKTGKEETVVNDNPNLAKVAKDKDYYSVRFIEEFDKDYNFTGLSKICYERVLGSVGVKAHAENESDALAISMNYKGRVDFDYMSEMLGGESKDDIVRNLRGKIFLVPNSEEEIYQTREEYLSGDVVQKLEDAKYALENGDHRFGDNVDALIEVQPAKRDFSEISVSLSSHWIPVEHFQSFVDSITDKDAFTIKYSKDASAFEVKKNTSENVSSGDERQYEIRTYGVKKSFKEVLETTLNNKFISIKPSNSTKTEDRDRALKEAKEATLEATQIQKALSDKFIEWLDEPAQQAVRDDIEAVYNRQFNSIVPRVYDGSHLTFEGMNPNITLRDHQKSAIAHTLYGGSTLIAHEVGAGKTFEMIASAMEAKRMGLAQKSLILVPPALLGQWGQDIYRLYPNCKALVPTDKEIQGGKDGERPDFIAKLANNDFDIVVMPHSTFDNFVRVSKERQLYFLENEVEKITAVYDEMRAESGKSKTLTIKNMESKIKDYKDKIKSVTEEDKRLKDNGNLLEFEEFGCDRLYVDEAHLYKNAATWTTLNGVKGINNTTAGKSVNMMMVTQYINEITDDRGVIFATGTPLTNSISEVYSMQSYIAPKKMKEKGIECLDDFISAFGSIDCEFELKPGKTEYEQDTRLRSFNNLKELKTMFREFTDIALTDELGLKLPTPHYEVVTADISPTQQELMKELSERINNLSSNHKQDNMLAIISDGRKIGLDPRLYDPTLPDEEGTKLNLVADKVAEIYKNSSPKDTQLIFSDLGVPGKGKPFDVYTELKKKLVERGVPEDQIADVYSCGKSDAKRKALFKKVDNGDIRILMGSTEKLGTGVNVQTNLLAVHHVDVKWKPSDLTQRNGRIIRQGNVHDDVHIYNYVTDKTFDAYQYQTLLIKQKFIRQFMSKNDSVANSMSDLDDQTLSINEALACCAGDPNIAKKAKLEGEVMLLAKEKSNFQKRKDQAKNKIALNNDRIELRQNEGAELTRLYEASKVNPVGSPLTIDGKVFTDRKLAGEALRKKAIEIANKQSGRIVECGEYRGIPIGISVKDGEKKFHIFRKSLLDISLDKRVSEAKDPTANMNFLDDIIDKQLPAQMSDLEKDIKEFKEESKSFEPVLAQTWNKQDSLNAVHDELMEVYASLKVDPPLNIRKIFDNNGLSSKLAIETIGEQTEITEAQEEDNHNYGLPEDPEKKARMEKLWDELQAVLSERHEMSMPDKKVYFDVPYEQRQEAKALGCKWDKDNKKWFISEATPERIEAMDKAGFKKVEVEQKNENLKSVQKNENADPKQKTLLSVPFEEKDLAKELGAKFDRETKCWHVPEGMDLKPFERWKPTVQHEKMWIKAPYEMHEQIKELGAKYDRQAKCWYVPENVDLKPFENLKQDHELNKIQSEKTDTPIAFFVEKMREAGLVIDKYPEINGRSTRVAVEGDKAGQKSGWYKIHTDGVPVCLFHNWRAGDGTQKLVAPSTKIDMSIDLEKVKVNTETIAAKLVSQEEATKQLHAEVAKNVQERLAVYRESEKTEYIQNKEIPVYKGIYATNRGATVVPLADVEGNIRTMQTILPAGTKMLEKGGELKGSMHVVNADNLAEATGGIVICEGYATGATIREATNGHFGVVCAMTSHNLHDVVKAISEKYPDKPLIIAGDNDRFNVHGNVGRLTAEAVAKEFGAKVIIPEFGENDRGSDFNDLKKSEGLDKVKAVFRQLIQKNKEERQEERAEKKKSRSR